MIHATMQSLTFLQASFFTYANVHCKPTNVHSLMSAMQFYFELNIDNISTISMSTKIKRLSNDYSPFNITLQHRFTVLRQTLALF